MTNKSGQMTWRSRFAVAVGLGLAVAAAACSEGVNTATSPSAVTPSSLALNAGQSTRNFSVTISPTSVSKGAATLHVTVTRDAMSGQGQKLGSVEIYVPSAFTIQSVSNISNANWTSGVVGQTVRVGVASGNNKLDADRISVTFDINVTSTECGMYEFEKSKASNASYYDAFESNWETISELAVTVTGCVPVIEECDAPAAPAVANKYLKSINISGGRGDDIISEVAHHMTEGARFDGIEKCNVEAYRVAVIAFVDKLLNP